jgi:hypothetical protein
MIITNLYGMPDVYERYVRRKFTRTAPLKEGSLSVTGIIDSPWKARLYTTHYDEIIMDVSEAFFAFRGSMMHSTFEDTKLMNAVPEIMLGMEFSWADKTVWLTGIMDLWQPYELSDYKMGTVAGFWYHDEDDVLKYAKQLNIYRYMFWKIFGVTINRLTVHNFLMDWKKGMIHQSNYPPHPHFKVVVPIWDYDSTLDYILSRLALHVTPIELMTPCSPLERWQRPPTWALIKEGSKRATRVCDTKEEILSYMDYKKIPHDATEYAVIERPGIDSRCNGYCNVNKWCSFYQENYLQDSKNVLDTVQEG